MSKYVLTILDTTGIQSYIFNSNRLRENIGASYLVEWSTKYLVEEKLAELGVPKDRQNEPIESSGLIAELIYAAGGNATILFRSIDDAKEFTKKLSRQILLEAPGLNIVAARSEFDWEEDSLYEKVKYLQKEELEKQKRARIPSVPLLGLGVTAFCKSTQLPAVKTSAGYFEGEETEHYLISRETEAKLKATSPQYKQLANRDLREKFEDVLKDTDYEFPYRLDRLGRSSGKSSYYAVVHADGNSMGNRFKEFGKSSQDNRDYINRMRKLSKSVNEAGKNAVKKVIQVLINSLENGELKEKISIKNDFLPFRPLVYGGDDITFVCDGRLGLELAAIFLQEFQKQEVADGKLLTACAGVCIVKSHYPFARAYQLSEALCSNAKKFVREQNQEFSAIDWHIAASGLLGSIGEIRQREYQVKQGDLTMRPLFIEGENTQDISDNKWCNWSNFTKVIQTFNNHEIWKGRHNKIIALREKLREGKEATKEFRKAYKIDNLPHIEGGDGGVLQEEGWTEGRCGYFDAIEAMEFYFPLNKVGEK
ncbi:MAG: hypothetical protein SWX82_19820 [Cyanobacteriota bacterium]|nr:hypothetical protein [Cyanobacteriota bacterium]